jgi:hypothetical protein
MQIHYTQNIKAGGVKMNKEQIENEKYKIPLSPRAEEFIYQMAHKTELLVADNQTLLNRLKAAEKVARKACKKIVDTWGYCPYESSDDDDEELADVLGCNVEDNCNTKGADCWFKYFSLGLDEKPKGAK